MIRLGCRQGSAQAALFRGGEYVFMRKYMILNGADNVAVALETLPRGLALEIPERGITVTLAADIDFEHKFALSPIPAGSHVVKYGASIGAAMCDIAPGEHVHLHNLRTLMADFTAPDGAWSNRIESK